MTTLTSKITTAGLAIGLAITNTYGVESFEENARSDKPTNFMYGHYVDYSEDLDATFSIRYENNKVNTPTTAEQRAKIKYMYISHAGMGKCIPEVLRTELSEFPNVEKLSLECEEASDINLGHLPMRNLREFHFHAPFYASRRLQKLPYPQDNNLNEELVCLQNAEKLEVLSVNAPNLSEDGVRSISRIPNLKRLNTIVYVRGGRHGLYAPSDNLLTPLWYNQTLDCINHEVSQCTGGYGAIDKLNESRRPHGFLPIPHCWDYDKRFEMTSDTKNAE